MKANETMERIMECGEYVSLVAIIISEDRLRPFPVGILAEESEGVWIDLRKPCDLVNRLNEGAIVDHLVERLRDIFE